MKTSCLKILNYKKGRTMTCISHTYTVFPFKVYMPKGLLTAFFIKNITHPSFLMFCSSKSYALKYLTNYTRTTFYNSITNIVFSLMAKIMEVPRILSRRLPTTIQTSSITTSEYNLRFVCFM